MVAGLRVQHEDKVMFVPFFIPEENRTGPRNTSSNPACPPASEQWSSCSVAERLVGLSKQCTRRVLLAARLPDLYWSYAQRSAICCRDVASQGPGFPWHAQAFGEKVGMWRSHDEKQAKSAHDEGAVGRLIAIGPWGNGTCTLIAKGTDVQDPELAYGL